MAARGDLIVIGGVWLTFLPKGRLKEPQASAAKQAENVSIRWILDRTRPS